MARLNFGKISLAFLLFSFLPLISFAADLKLIAGSNSYAVGDNVTISVQLVSPSQAANAVYGVIDFPTDKLQVTSISKAGSVVNLWVQEPSFTNSSGQITFEGAILNPGFKGSAGRLITVNLKAKSSGTAKLALSNGSILANDGQGTSILKNLGATTITITAKETPTKPKEEPVKKEPIPAEKKTTVASSTRDTTPPQLEVNEIKTTAGDRARFAFIGKDAGSGIDRYEFQLDDSDIQMVLPDGTNIYNTPSLSSGRHTLTITVYDKAGNQTKRQLDFAISLPIANSIWTNWGPSIITVLSIVVPIVCLLIILILILSLGWNRASTLNKKRLRREVNEAEDNLHKTFDLIREDLQAQVV
ncbi:MAG: cohesin domain-containing protein, partial [Candidatus Paceibacterota bacterium]